MHVVHSVGFMIALVLGRHTLVYLALLQVSAPSLLIFYNLLRPDILHLLLIRLDSLSMVLLNFLFSTLLSFSPISLTKPIICWGNHFLTHRSFQSWFTTSTYSTVLINLQWINHYIVNLRLSLVSINIWTTTTWSNVCVILPKPSWYDILIGFLIWTTASRYLHLSPISVWFYSCSYICNCLKMPKKSQINKYRVNNMQ